MAAVFPAEGVSVMRQLTIHRLVRTIAFALTVGAASIVLAGANSIAPDFNLPARAGGSLSLSKLKGQVVMINFWASYCGPCRQEMPLLDQMAKKYKSLGFTLL